MLLPGRGPLTIGFLTINVPFNEDTDIYYSKWKEVSKGMAYEWQPGFGKSAHTVRSLEPSRGTGQKPHFRPRSQSLSK